MRRPELQIVTPRQVLRLCGALGPERLLSRPELAAYRRLAHEVRRRDWLAARLAAKLLVRRALLPRSGRPVPFRHVAVLRAPDGAPTLRVAGPFPDTRSWRISLAHAEGVGACLLGRGAAAPAVGVDVEPERPLDPAMLPYFLGEDERADLASAGGGGRVDPLALWGMKEAVLKAGGLAAGATMHDVRLRWRERRAALRGPHGAEFSVGWGRGRGCVVAYARAHEQVKAPAQAGARRRGAE